jgi:hypothetical protein
MVMGFVVKNRSNNILPQQEHKGPSCYKIRKFCKQGTTTHPANKFILYLYRRKSHTIRA